MSEYFDQGTNAVQAAITHYLQTTNLIKEFPMVCDAVISFTAIRGESGEQELITAATHSPYWTLHGMLMDSIEAVLSPVYQEDEYDED